MIAVEHYVHVMQGEYAVSASPNEVMSTVLGSCVAACLYDPALRIGGMNHYLLPGGDPQARANVKYGLHLMEELINAMLKAGALRARIEVQLFGGGNVLRGLQRIGDSNAEFALRFVAEEGFRLTRRDLGGARGRRLRFWPSTGAAEVAHFDGIDTSADRPGRVPRRATRPGAVELF